MLSKEDVEKFRKIYRKNFGKEISYQDAYDSAIKLITLVKLVYRPIKKSDLEKLKARDKELKEKETAK